MSLGVILQACGGGAGAPASSAAVPPAGSAGASAKPVGSAAASAKPAGSTAASAKPAGSSSAGGSAAGKPGAAGKLTVSYGSVAGSFWPLWMAKEGGFDKYGITVDMPLIETNAAVAAVISKQVDSMEVSAAPIISADSNGNEDIVLIASALNHPILALYTTPEITSAEQLKGKQIASGPPGSPVDYAAKVALSLLGLKPTDVALRNIGTAEQITAALLSGQLPAGMVAPPQTFQVEAKGFKLLKDIYDQPYQNVGLFSKKSRLDELSSRMKPLLAAYRDGIAAIYDKPDQAIKVLDQYAKVGDQDILKKTYDFYTNPKFAPFQKDMQPTMPGIQAQIDFLAQTVEKVKGHKAEEFVDLRFLSDLPK